MELFILIILGVIFLLKPSNKFGNSSNKGGLSDFEKFDMFDKFNKK